MPDVAIGAIPNLLGFTVGAFAIVLAFSSADIFQHVAEGGDPFSFFMKLTANLVHFILIQVVALISAILAKITESAALSTVALFFTIYGILVTVSVALQLFHTAIIYNAASSLDGRNGNDDEKGET